MICHDWAGWPLECSADSRRVVLNKCLIMVNRGKRRRVFFLKTEKYASGISLDKDLKNDIRHLSWGKNSGLEGATN